MQKIDKIITKDEEISRKTGMSLHSSLWKVRFTTGNEIIDMEHICSSKRVKEVVLNDTKEISSPLTVEIFTDKDEKVFMGTK